jgi:hypothetical protein
MEISQQYTRQKFILMITFGSVEAHEREAISLKKAEIFAAIPELGLRIHLSSWHSAKVVINSNSGSTTGDSSTSPKER